MLLETMRKNARFALQVTKADQPLPHAKEIRVQAGGLYGLQQLLNNKSTTAIEALTDTNSRYDDSIGPPIKDINHTITQGLLHFKEIKNFPFTEIIKTILRFKLPSRRKKN